MVHIILCGDSIFDNQRYIQPGELNVTNQVRSLLLPGPQVTGLALDGEVTNGISRQLQSLPEDATHLVISIGGNDALGHLDLFSRHVNTVGEALLLLSEMRTRFEHEYRTMLEQAIACGLPVTVCTIYYPRFHTTSLERISAYTSDPSDGERLQNMAMGALAVYNDIITKEAFHAGIPIIDLRVLCHADQDFANAIEPSAQGGKKIARLIKDMTCSHDFSQKESRVYC